jgi:hypothetical protein
VTDRRFHAWLATTAAVGAALRVAVFLAEHRGDELGFNDAPYYSRQAFDLAAGTLFRDERTGAPGAEHGPLTAVLLAPFSFTDSVDVQRIGSVAPGVVTVALLGLVGRHLGGARAGLATAGVAALYPNLWLNDGIVMAEVSGALLVATWLLAGLWWRSSPTSARAAAWGAAGALAALARSELALLVIASTVGLVMATPREGRRRWVPVAGALLAAAAVAGPWVAWNSTRFERVVLLTTNDGTTLRGANCDDAYHGRATGSWVIECLAAGESGDAVDLETSVRAATWRSDGIDYARDHLARLPVVVAARVGRLLDVYGVGWMIDEDVRDDRPRWGSRLGVVTWWGLAPVAALGIVSARRRFDRALLVAPVVVVLTTTVLFYGGHRLRSPMEPVVAVGAGLAVTRWRGAA